VDFDLRAFVAGADALDVKKFWGDDLSGEEWNARMTEEGLLNCLMAVEAANGDRFRTKAMILQLFDGDGRREKRKKKQVVKIAGIHHP
jgi:hypothetical protein